MRPTCINPGCNKPVAHCGKRYRPVCARCHRAGYGADTYAPGVTPYRQNKCSNTDGHLGFTCYIDWTRVNEDNQKIKTHIDHIDGNHLNNSPDNAEELCETCHTIKSIRNGDYSGYRYEIEIDTIDETVWPTDEEIPTTGV